MTIQERGRDADMVSNGHPVGFHQRRQKRVRRDRCGVPALRASLTGLVPTCCQGLLEGLVCGRLRLVRRSHRESATR